MQDKNRLLSKGFLLPCLLAIFLSLSSCGGISLAPQEEAAQEVLNFIFTPMTEKEYDAFLSSASALGEGTDAPISSSEITFPDKLKGFITNDCFQSLAGISLYPSVAMTAYENNLTLDVKDLSLSDKQGSTDFSFTLSVQNGDSKKEIDLSGSMQFDEHDKISYLEIYNTQDLLENE